LDLRSPTSKGREGKVNMTGMGKDRDGEEGGWGKEKIRTSCTKNYF